MSAEIVAMIASTATLLVAMASGFGWMITRMDARFAQVDARFARIEHEITEVKIAIARIEGPPRRLEHVR